MIPKSEVGTRYANLYAALDHVLSDKHLDGVNYYEVGVFDGTRTLNLAAHWNVIAHGRPFNYVGFDLFEAVDPKAHGHEILKSKPSPARSAVHAKLEASGLFDRIELVAGDTRETLPRFAARRPVSRAPDLVLIDGGHSLETIESDWAAIESMLPLWALVLFDDYMPDRIDAGAKPLVDRLARDPEFTVELLDPIDHFPHNGMVTRFAKVTRTVL